MALFVFRVNLTRSYGRDTIAVVADDELEARRKARLTVRETAQEHYDFMEPEDFEERVESAYKELLEPPARMPLGTVFVKGSD